MAENNNDLEMGLFGMDTDLELNLGYNPDEDTTEDPAETPEQQDNVLDIPGQPGEDTPEQLCVGTPFQRSFALTGPRINKD